MEEKELSAWLSLCLTPDISNKSIRFLLQHFNNNVEQIIHPRRHEKNKEICSLVAQCRAHKAKPETNKKIQQALLWQQEKQQHIITLHSDTYPPLLKEIPDPPLLLYVIGSLQALTLPQIAMVGSRKASPGGRAMAKRLAGDLATGGYSVCSGMALGIDSESHMGALEKQGVSVAVLGSGIDQIYPRSNLNLAEQLAVKGALVSEFPLGTPPKPWHFPQRNRIISGLSQGVVVVEAALKSGSLITARYALEQGREVFAVPGSPHNPQAKGCHHLLKNGAKLVESAADIVEELGAFIDLGHEQLLSKANKTKGLNKVAQTLLQHIDYEVTNIELLIHQTGINAELIGSLLIELELEGLISSRQGGYSLALA
ncbi:MAG: DNA-protecting protein DprA [SAR86 cluster bacterium]|uniref:DNA-protecting protein DprA n=1 Tax=SAR86 cluster bacterium TaxID=2030880 RepID=A0A2A5CJI7_9GAMM|nr:DNA-processing protein DprA [Gammaproteobacteria bacterium AH-315-E17]PCJ43536.1 MAG: DNA-protecting protein DprA [SAR86 cluster bacterium]